MMTDATSMPVPAPRDLEVGHTSVSETEHLTPNSHPRECGDPYGSPLDLEDSAALEAESERMRNRAPLEHCDPSPCPSPAGRGDVSSDLEGGSSLRAPASAGRCRATSLTSPPRPTTPGSGRCCARSPSRAPSGSRPSVSRRSLPPTPRWATRYRPSSRANGRAGRRLDLGPGDADGVDWRGAGPHRLPQRAAHRAGPSRTGHPGAGVVRAPISPRRRSGPVFPPVGDRRERARVASARPRPRGRRPTDAHRRRRDAGIGDPPRPPPALEVDARRSRQHFAPRSARVATCIPPTRSSFPASRPMTTWWSSATASRWRHCRCGTPARSGRRWSRSIRDGSAGSGPSSTRRPSDGRGAAPGPWAAAPVGVRRPARRPRRARPRRGGGRGVGTGSGTRSGVCADRPRRAGPGAVTRAPPTPHRLPKHAVRRHMARRRGARADPADPR